MDALPPFTAFSLGTRRLELAQATRGEALRFAARDLPPGLFDASGQVLRDPDALAREVAALLAEHRLKVRTANLAFGGAPVWRVATPAPGTRRTRPLTGSLPGVPAETSDPAAWLARATGGRSPFADPAATPLVAAAPLGTKADDDEPAALVAALRADTAERLVVAFQQAGVNLQAIEPRFTAHLRGAASLGLLPAFGRDPRRWGLLLLDGASVTLAAWAGQRLLAATTVPLPEGPADGQLSLDAEAIVRQEVAWVAASEHPTSWLVAGPIAQAEALRDRLKLAGVPTLLAPRTPGRRVLAAPPTASVEALGAGLRGVEPFPGRLTFDLPAAPARGRIGGSLAMAALALVAAGVAGATWAAWLDQEASRLQAHQTALYAEQRVLHLAVHGQVGRSGSDVLAAAISEQDDRVARAFTLIQDQIPKDAWLTQLRLGPGLVFELQGEALSRGSSGAFASNLRSSGATDQLRLEATPSARPPYRFRIAGPLRPDVP